VTFVNLAYFIHVPGRARSSRDGSCAGACCASACSRSSADTAVADERTRIARELHDVVAHAISVVVLQARGGRKVLTEEPAAAREAFDVIEQVSEQALTEMRRLLGLLRQGDDELVLARSRA